jgi:hypothetical protein
VLQPLLTAAASVEQNPVVGPDQPAPAWLEQSLVVGAAQAPPASNLEQSPVGADQMLPLPAVPANATINQVGIDYMLTTNEDVKELAEMIRVAAQCGEDDARTVWSEEEQNELLSCLHLYVPFSFFLSSITSSRVTNACIVHSFVRSFEWSNLSFSQGMPGMTLSPVVSRSRFICQGRLQLMSH